MKHSPGLARMLCLGVARVIIIGVTAAAIRPPINDIHSAVWMHEDAKLSTTTKNDIQRQPTTTTPTGPCNRAAGPRQGVRDTRMPVLAAIRASSLALGFCLATRRPRLDLNRPVIPPQSRPTGVAKSVMLSVMLVAPTGGPGPHTDLVRHRMTTDDNQNNRHENRKYFSTRVLTMVKRQFRGK